MSFVSPSSTKERSAFVEMQRQQCSQVAALQAEIARLTAALEEIGRIHRAYQESEDSPSALAYLQFAGEVGSVLMDIPVKHPH